MSLLCVVDLLYPQTFGITTIQLESSDTIVRNMIPLKSNGSENTQYASDLMRKS